MQVDPSGPLRASVVMCARDEADFIERAIASVLDQGHDDVEVVVVDDHSRDRTAEVAGSFDGVKVVTNTGEGLVDALNVSVASAASDLLVRLDADDWHLPGSIDALVGALEAHPTATFASGCARYVDEAGRLLGRHPAMPTAEHLRVVAMVICPLEHTASAYRRSVVERIGGYRAERGVQVAEDNDLWLRLLDAGEGYVGLAEEVAVHVVRTASVTNEFSAEGDERGRRARADFRRRHGDELCSWSGLRRLGRQVVSWSDPTGRSALFSYVLVRLAHLSLQDREIRRAATVAAVALGLGPHIVARGAISVVRQRLAFRRARGLDPRSHLVDLVFGQRGEEVLVRHHGGAGAEGHHAAALEE